VNSPQKPPLLNDWLRSATWQLADASIPSARLDAEIILAHTIGKNRTFLHAHGDMPLEPRLHEIADARLRLRLDRTPIAYIVGHKEFYGRLFKVTPATLIPRPESEDIITLVKELLSKNTSLLATQQRLVDVGTGSGCLGITAKCEIPELDVTLLDISQHALTVARKNAEKLHADITITRSDLLDHYPFTTNFIVANLPYVDPSWQRSPETQHEPAIALFASDNGLHLVKKLITQAPSHLAPGGFLLLEADPRQHKAIVETAKNHDLRLRSIRGFVVCLEK
jgi:release factor glutamine methyltransferase